MSVGKKTEKKIKPLCAIVAVAIMTIKAISRWREFFSKTNAKEAKNAM